MLKKLVQSYLVYLIIVVLYKYLFGFIAYLLAIPYLLMILDTGTIKDGWDDFKRMYELRYSYWDSNYNR